MEILDKTISKEDSNYKDSIDIKIDQDNAECLLFLDQNYKMLDKYLDSNLLMTIMDDLKMAQEKAVSSTRFSKRVDVQKYKNPSKISIYEHTMNVAKCIIDDTTLSFEDKRVALLYALLHDIGKSKNICDKYNINVHRGHEHASAQYIQKALANYSSYSNIFTGIVDYLSNKNAGNRNKSYYAKILEKCDQKARELEEN